MFNFEDANKHGKEAFDLMLRAMLRSRRASRRSPPKPLSSPRSPSTRNVAHLDKLSRSRAWKLPSNSRPATQSRPIEAYVAEARRSAKLYADLAKGATSPTKHGCQGNGRCQGRCCCLIRETPSASRDSVFEFAAWRCVPVAFRGRHFVFRPAVVPARHAEGAAFGGQVRSRMAGDPVMNR